MSLERTKLNLLYSQFEEIISGTLDGSPLCATFFKHMHMHYFSSVLSSWPRNGTKAFSLHCFAAAFLERFWGTGSWTKNLD